MSGHRGHGGATRQLCARPCRLPRVVRAPWLARHPSRLRAWHGRAVSAGGSQQGRGLALLLHPLRTGFLNVLAFGSSAGNRNEYKLYPELPSYHERVGEYRYLCGDDLYPDLHALEGGDPSGTCAAPCSDPQGVTLF